MLRVGDIVTVKPEYNGSNALFQIVEDTEKNQSERYKIVFTKIFHEQDEYDSARAKSNEKFLWSEEDLVLIRTIDSIQCEAHTISYEYGPIIERIKKVYKNTIENYSNNIEESFWTARSINFDQYEYEIYENEQKNEQENKEENKEENNMNKENEIDKILNIYLNKKEIELKEEATKKMEKVLEKDPIKQLIKEMNNQLKIIVENAGEDLDNYLEIEYDKVLAATDKEKFEVKKTYYKKQEELENKYNEVKALAMLADTYEERIKVLKNNGILDNKGNFKD